MTYKQKAYEAGMSIRNQRYYFRCLTENKNKHKSTQGIKEKLKWDEHPDW